MTNCSHRHFFDIRHFVIPSTFVIRLPRRSLAKAGHSSFGGRAAFTILELLVVMTIIIVLAGLILATVGYVQKKGARSRAEAEMAAMSAALESYRADNGIYPTDLATTEQLKATDSNPNNYAPASRFLYKQLTGDDDGDPTTAAPANAKNYLGGALKPQMLSPNPPGPNTFIRDPFGNSYGYSTLKAVNPASPDGYNPTFDLWSTANANPAGDQNQWVKNW
jgi:type II secretory pathway pseudopilin PulG